MDLNSVAIHDVIHPTAAFSKRLETELQTPWGDQQAGGHSSSCWDNSQLNPKNRIDSLDPPPNPLWRVDGCTSLGTQYYAIPRFLRNVPPMRFDVFIPEEAMGSPLLRELLDLDVAFHAKNSARLARLGICNHILRALQHWTSTGQGSPEGVENMYASLPFGSRIVFENLDVDVRKIRITVGPAYYVERQLLSIPSLTAMWDIPVESLPPSIDIGSLGFVQQLHDSVCVVRVRRPGDAADGDGEDSGELAVLKALISGTKFLYHELHTLLNMPPHPNVVGRPTRLVTKRCLFGGKIAVVGFMLPYHTGGNITEELPFLRAHNRLTVARQVKWALQLASAVVHVFEDGKIFYPDLRLDNVVLSETEDIVMVDFEQRGVWCEFGSPEVNAIEYIRILATDDAAGFRFEPAIPEDVRDRYFSMMSRYLPGWEKLDAREAYEYRPGGFASYNIAWECLDAVEREAAEVYMLGRALWCIFEGAAAPQRAAAWQSYKWEPEVEFPGFLHTPPELRELVERCTRGRREVLSSVVVRKGSKMVLASTDGDRAASPDAILSAAKLWWAAEVQYAEEFLDMRERMRQQGTWESNYFGRPTLRDVLATLEGFRAEMGLP